MTNHYLIDEYGLTEYKCDILRLCRTSTHWKQGGLTHSITTLYKLADDGLLTGPKRGKPHSVPFELTPQGHDLLARIERGLHLPAWLSRTRAQALQALAGDGPLTDRDLLDRSHRMSILSLRDAHYITEFSGPDSGKCWQITGLGLEALSEYQQTQPNPPVVFPENTTAIAEVRAEERELPPEKVLYELVPLDLVDPNPYQPRLSQDADALARLARGIRLKRAQLPDTCGLMQVPVARKVPPSSDGEGEVRYQLAFGHRRYKAFKFNRDKLTVGETLDNGDVQVPAPQYDWSKIPLQIISLSDEEIYDFAARENGDREDLNDIDRARSIKRAVDELGWGLTRAANAHGLSKSAGSNLVRLLLLPEPVLDLMTQGLQVGEERRYLGQRHARELVRLIQFDPSLADECAKFARDLIKHETPVDELSYAISTHLRKLERRKHTEIRYCYSCGASRSFTGEEIDRAGTARCAACGNNWNATWWYKDRPKCEGCGKEHNGQKWTKIDVGVNNKWYCEECGRKVYEEAPCPRCGKKKVYYSKSIAGLKCELCLARWSYTSQFQAEIEQAVEERLRRHAEAELSTSEPPATVSPAAESSQTANQIRPLLCHRCHNGRVVKKQGGGGGLICLGCDFRWNHLADFRSGQERHQTSPANAPEASPLSSEAGPGGEVAPPPQTTWQLSLDPENTCYLCGRPASYHHPANFHLCSRCFYTISDPGGELHRLNATDLRAILDQLKQAQTTPPTNVQPVDQIEAEITEALTHALFQGDLNAWLAVIYQSEPDPASRERFLSHTALEQCQDVARFAVRQVSPGDFIRQLHGWLAKFDLEQIAVSTATAPTQEETTL
jgi:ParB-like chromosome segregation protein Spo0J